MVHGVSGKDHTGSCDANGNCNVLNNITNCKGMKLNQINAESHFHGVSIFRTSMNIIITIFFILL